MKTKEHAQGGIRLSPISLFLVIALCSTGIGIAGAEPVMSIIPSTTSVDVGDNFSVFIEVDPAGYTLLKANTDLTFDSSKVSILEVVNCGTFEFIFIGGTLGDGIIDGIVGVSMVGVSSTGNLAEIRMHADNPGTFTIGLSDAEVGTATATLTPDINNGTVTVGAAQVLTTITVSPPTADLTVGETQLFTATAYDQYGAPMAGIVLIWVSTNTTVGTVDPTSATTGVDGNATTTFTAVAEGTTAVGAINGSVYGTAVVTVTPMPTVSIGSAEGSVGDTVDVSINITDASKIGAIDIRVTYDASILNATNVANGSMMQDLPDLLWAYNISSEGEVNISLATYPTMINGTGELFVVTFDIVGGDSSILAINAEAWTGEVPAQPVTVAVENGSVTVTAAPVLTTITVSPTTASLTVGDTQLFTATAYDQFQSVMPDVVFTWASSNTTVGTIDDTGLFTALAAGTTTVAAYNGAVYGTAVVTVTPPSSPVVTITTDAITYSPGDTMIVTLDIANPTSDPVVFEWYIGVPERGIRVTYKRAPIPAGFDNPYTIPIPVGNWGPTPFDFVHYVRMLDYSGDVLVYDVAWCAYSPDSGEAKPVDIADEIIKTAERVEFSI